MRPTQELTLEREDNHGKVFSHPAFGQIRANRVSGRANLYDSDFDHNHYVIVEISGSQLVRNLHRDWHHARETKVQVAMTEAQWATFVSSFGMGGGVPCTIQQINLEMVPGLPEPTTQSEQFANELKEDLQSVLAKLDAAIAGAKTKTQANELGLIRQDLAANLPFLTESFDRHMEKTVERAKGEVHGYINAAIHRAGVQAIADGAPFALPSAEPQALEDHSAEAGQ